MVHVSNRTSQPIKGKDFLLSDLEDLEIDSSGSEDLDPSEEAELEEEAAKYKEQRYNPDFIEEHCDITVEQCDTTVEHCDKKSGTLRHHSGTL